MLEWAFTLDPELEAATAHPTPFLRLVESAESQRDVRARLLCGLLMLGALEVVPDDPKLSRNATQLLKTLRTLPIIKRSRTSSSTRMPKPAQSSVSKASLAAPSHPVSNPSVSRINAPSSGKIPNPQLKRIYEVVLNDYRRVLAPATPYQVLRVSESDAIDFIRRRYEQFERFYRPDNFSRLGDAKLYQLAVEIRQALARALAEIEAAQLGEAGARGVGPGERSFDSGRSYVPVAPDSDDPLAQIFFNDGLTYLRVTAFREAKHHFGRAFELMPHQATFRALSFWTDLFLVPRSV